MKRSFFLLAIVGFLFTACDKNDDKSTKQNKLPSKITYTINTPSYSDTVELVISFDYDEQNRMTKISYEGGGYEEISYNSDNNPVKIVSRDGEGTRWSNYEFIYSGNSMFVKQSDEYFQEEGPITWKERMDTLLLENGRIIKWIDGERTESFTYNSNGNVTRNEVEYSSGAGHSYDYEYTDIKSIFRNANIPDWLLYRYFGSDYSGKGYMLKKVISDKGDTDEYTYETKDDYVSKRTYVGVEESPSNPTTEVITYEYIDAK